MPLFAHLAAKGVTLRLVDGKLRAYGDITDEVRAVIREHREELLATLAGRPLSSGLEAPQGGAAATLTNGQAADISTPVRHTRQRALTNAPPPHVGPLTDGQQGPQAFLYSVLKDGFVTRGTFISQDIRTEPEALELLRKRYPELKTQWVRVVTHPVCSGCRYYTGGVLCNADQSPDYAASVGHCEKHAQAGEL
jgi:hypothetical protein